LYYISLVMHIGLVGESKHGKRLHQLLCSGWLT